MTVGTRTEEKDELREWMKANLCMEPYYGMLVGGDFFCVKAKGHQEREGHRPENMAAIKVAFSVSTRLIDQDRAGAAEEKKRLAAALEEGCYHIMMSQQEQGEGSVRFDTVELFRGLAIITQQLAELHNTDGGKTE